ncbi:GspH/FimT family pseudopilin [Jeongeupia wiesaeckerbachi]|uniref:GspH/FimT family pseudopilin n=1 Tax=Jeongeupia wiesaeckerbachi TaxID=3051218 RepID=UPI003D80963C
MMRRLPASLHRIAGASLIEVMVTVSILGILAAIAVPSMVTWVRDARLASQTDLLVSTLNTARLEAIKRRSSMTVCPSTDANSSTASCSTTASDWSKGWLVDDASSKILRLLVPQGINVTTAGSVTSVVFNPTLGSTQAAATFSLCISGRKQQQVAVALSGRVSKMITSTVCT